MSELAPCPRCGHDGSYPDIVDSQPCRKCAKCHRELIGSHGPTRAPHWRADKQAQAVRRMAGIVEEED